MAASPEELGDRIRQRREALGLTQEQLAAKADIGSAGLRAIEHGRQQPRHGTLRQIAVALGVPVEKLTAPDVTRKGAGDST